MGILQASVEPQRIRASVAITATGDTTNATQLNKLTAGVQYVFPAATLEHIYIVLGIVVDSIGYNKFFYDLQAIADQVSLGVSKGFFETQAVTDETTYVLFKKGAIEQLSTAETRRMSLAKQVDDLVDATDDFQGTANTDDDQVMVFSKTVSSEYQTVSDSTRVTTGKGLSEAVASDDEQVFNVDKGLTDILGTTEDRSTFFEKTLSDAVDAGDEFNAVALTDDGEVMIFGKTLADDFTQADEVSVQPEKGIEDVIERPTDQIDYIEVGKGIEDVPVTSETLGFDTSKPLETEATTADFTAFGFGAGLADRVSYGDGPNAYDTYAVGYFAETYCLEGFPALSFSKTLADTVHSTDDFFGVANADDDETMQFGKTLGEVFHQSDEATVAYSKAVLDLASFEDFQVLAIGKVLTDQVNKSDLAIKGTDKVLSDSKTVSDSAVRGFGKGLEDNPTTAEYNSFAISKLITDSVVSTDDFLGNANADDDETMLFGKTISDSFTKSDSTVKTAGKGLADTASTSESGSIVWTDYWPIGYTDTTSGVYVGNSQTF